nr:acyl-CoA dehydrogenase family protein [Algiphilus aromaticivorans]
MMSSIDWRDPLQLQAQLSPEERAGAEAAARFAREALSPGIRAAYRDEHFDRALVRQFGQLGLFGLTLEDHGCPGGSHLLYGLVARAIEGVDSAYRSLLSVQSSLVMYPIHRFGSPEQRSRYLPELAGGRLLGAFGLTEPDHGSDPGGMHTRARRGDDGSWRLSGTKTWISHAPIADLLLVWARDEEDRINGFLVERDTPGLSTPAIDGKLSLRASPTGQIALDDAPVPEARRLPGASGIKAPFACLSKARYGICWGTMGAAESCWHAARDYVLEREQFGRPLAANQLVQRKLADMQTEIALGLQAALRLGQLLDAGESPHEAVSLLKRNNAGKALDIARQARDMLGANGISDAYPVMRHMLNLETVNTYEGTHDVHALILGRWQTGIASF